jgi:hypothetical protein
VTFSDTPGKQVLKGKDLCALEVRIPNTPGSETVYYRALK